MMKREKNLRRFMAFLLSAALMLSMYIPAFASDAESGTPALPTDDTGTEDYSLENGHEDSGSAPSAVMESPEPSPESPEEPEKTQETAAQATGETPAPEQTTIPEQTTTPEQETNEAVAYTLHLTHYFRFTVNGEKQNVQAAETLELTDADFQDGICDLSRFACMDERLTVTEAKSLSLEAFDESRTGGARIVYAVADGWKLVPADEAGGEGTALRDVFQGKLEDYVFVPAKVVRVNMQYKYSSTGGLAGIDAAAPEVVEALPMPEKNGGSYEFEFSLPTTPDGFRIVLDPTPLNRYLVTPPTGNETPEQLQQMLENGDFSVDVANKEVYYYQEVSKDPLENPLHPTYENRYSTDFNHAWNAARILTVGGVAGYTAQAYCGDESHTGHVIGDHGANALSDPKLKVTLTEEQLQNAWQNGLNITVYYRRNATWYTVKHWVPKSFCSDITITDKETKEVGGVTYVLRDQERLQGRVGGLTRAAAKTGDVYDQLVPQPFTQQIVKNAGTAVDIYYKEADSYRVIFNTDDTYIPRQQVKLGDSVIFDNNSKPTRKGYTFIGWQYLKKSAVPDENGEYKAEDYELVTDESGNSSLTITADLITQKAKLQETDGVPVLYLYPLWVPGETQVTVILWTEDLTGVDDVQASVSSGSSSYYEGKYAGYSAAPKTHAPETGASYSNVGSFTMNVTTDSSLVTTTDSSRALLREIQNEVNEKFKAAVQGQDGYDNSLFYTQNSFEILHESGIGSASTAIDVTTASADGKTMIYVYFTRNIYTLKFHYYGTATVNDEQSDYCVALSTNGFSYAGVDKIIDSDGNLIFYYTAWHEGKNNTYARPLDITSAEGMPVPQTITVRAKYGADLRAVWPAARLEEHIQSTTEGEATMISWATTQGKYRDEGFPNCGSPHQGEPTIMGLYATMDAEIIADPSKPDQLADDDTLTDGTVHNLVAYWYNNTISYYRYNHCFELPGLDIKAVTGVQTVSLYNDSIDLKNTLYLVPVNTASITKYGFTDLMQVSYDKETETINYSPEEGKGTYYAVRGFQSDDSIKYYALGRRVEARSSNDIAAQNPSARLHMTRANDNADHTTKHVNTDGRTWGDNPVRVGEEKDPYDLYFYYNRDRYTITYMAPMTNSADGKNEVELGHIDLPYGAYVTQDSYAFKLGFTDTNQAKFSNGEAKYLWTYPDGGEVPVCPDRSPDGTAEWKFKGWGLGPAGVNMQWVMPDETTPQAQAQVDFYIDSNLLLYAIWEAPKLTVTFHLNGGVVSGNTGQAIEYSVPANRTYSSVPGAAIPRPVFNGHTLDGWYISDEDGTIPDEGTPFDFDSLIIENMHVAAKWMANTDERYSYKVYYVTKDLKKDDTAHTKKVWIKDDGSIVADGTEGGTECYVLETDEVKDRVFVDNLVLNLTAKGFAGYTPKETNKTLTVERGDKNTVVFYYDPQSTSTHTVKFVMAGTEGKASPTIVKTLVVTADQTVVTPNADVVKELTKLGYQLVNKSDKGTYTAVTDYNDLTWLDDKGQTKSVDTLPKENIPDVVTYLVQPTVYTITYQKADGLPQEVDSALDAVTAAPNTSVSGADGKNPTEYTVNDCFTLINPADVYGADGTRYRFSHWSLGTGTTGDPTGNGTYNPLEVEAGTVGNLTFIANWEKVPTGDLKVTKTVEGDLGNRQKEFSFTVELSDTSISGQYGGVTFTNGKATFTLKHGEEETATGLPEGTTYKVTEDQYAGYTTNAVGDMGTIQNGVTATAEFTNTRTDSVPTGIHDGMEAWKIVAGLLLALAGTCAYTVYCGRRRRRQGQ